MKKTTNKMLCILLTTALLTGCGSAGGNNYTKKTETTYAVLSFNGETIENLQAVLEYEYDRDGRVICETGYQGAKNGKRLVVATEYTYAKDGQLESLRRFTGNQATESKDSCLQSIVYTCDENGNITGATPQRLNDGKNWEIVGEATIPGNYRTVSDFHLISYEESHSNSSKDDIEYNKAGNPVKITSYATDGSVSETCIIAYK